MSKIILLIEDNADDELLTIRALKKNNISNEIVVMRDGQQAMEYLFGGGVDGVKLEDELPQVVLLDLKLPKIDGLEILEAIRNNKKTQLLYYGKKK